ncbi:MAG: hypothetical protein OXP70_06105 [Acidobacteriota bacterium]|nr:hypothetical protein [Acidobacteriota bacterium]
MNDDDYQSDATEYGTASSVDARALRAALCDLTLLGDDPFLSMQALNLAMVDAWLTPLEEELLRKLIREDRTPALEALFISAQSQMWIFAVYELLRAWRQRAMNMRKWARNGGLKQKLAALRQDRGFVHVGREIRASQIERILEEPDAIDVIHGDLKRTHIPFTRLEAIRVSLAKHEVRRKKNSVALHPGYGRINPQCGALDYEIEVGGSSLGTINRRDIAEDMRALPGARIPSDDELEAFDAFMRGPTVRSTSVT